MINAGLFRKVCANYKGVNLIRFKKIRVKMRIENREKIHIDLRKLSQ